MERGVVYRGKVGWTFHLLSYLIQREIVAALQIAAGALVVQ